MAGDTEEMQTDEDRAKAMVRAVYEDGEATINERTYRFTKMTHKKRRRVFAFYTRVMHQIRNNDFSFLDSPEFEPVESVIMECTSYDHSLLAKLGDAHWEKYPDDYLTFISTAMAAMSYPFMPVDRTDSGSGSDGTEANT